VELSWPIKLRIAAVVATGVVLIGILAWPLAAPHDPLGAVCFSNLSDLGAVYLVLIAFLVGFFSYFISWPYGREIGILAVPSGLAIWAGRSGSLAELIQLGPALSQRQALFASLKWEPFFWLLIIAAGLAGVLFGQKIWPRSHKAETSAKSNPQPAKYLNAIVALIGSAFIAHFCIKVLALDFTMSNDTNNTLVAQPAVGQIIFAVLVSFGLAAFIVNKFLNTSYIWPTLASVLVTVFAVVTYAKQDVLQNFVESWPATFFSSSVVCVLPLQMVVFGSLGSIVGYWMAIRYTYHKKHEQK
jgi:hypothetical protein